MNKYILLEELKKLIKNKMNELHELRKEPGILPKDAYTAMMVGVDEIREELGYLPTIDPIEEIDKMQEELKKSPDYMNDKLAGPVREKLLEELKSRLSTNL